MEERDGWTSSVVAHAAPAPWYAEEWEVLRIAQRERTHSEYAAVNEPGRLVRAASKAESHV